MVVFATISGYAAAVKEPVGLLIAAARRKMKRAVHERVAPHGLTTQQFWALVNIDEADRPSLREVAERMRMDAPTASRAVTQLLRRQLRSEEHTSELQSQSNLVCRLLLEKKKKRT